MKSEMVGIDGDLTFFFFFNLMATRLVNASSFSLFFFFSPPFVGPWAMSPLWDPF